MRKGRIDYRMQRRTVLRDVVAGLRSREDVCDAHPDLLRAGTHLGSLQDDDCPVCDERELRHVTYVFEAKNHAKHPGGRAVPRESLAGLVDRYGDLTVYTVEVCLGCAWHHLLESFLLLARDPEARPRRRRPVTGS